MIRVLRILGIMISLSPLPAVAQMSIGTTSQMQIGWSASNKSTNRFTNVNQRGTSGENIVPTSGDKFQIYGSQFKINDKTQSFSYSSIANDSYTVTDIQQDNFSVFSNYSGTSTRTTRPSLGSFDKGNSRFSQ